MNKEKLNIAIHCADSEIGGVYDVLASFSKGLYDAFKQSGIACSPTCDYINAKKYFNIAIGFNVSFCNIWEEILENNIYNVMWSVDSIFAQNFKIVNKLQNNDKFVVFTVREDDIALAKKLIPNLKIFYLPHATNPDLWRKTVSENDKDFEIILMSSVCDYEEKFKNFLNSIDKKNREIATEIYHKLLNYPQLKFSDIYEDFCSQNIIAFSANTYSAFYNVYLPIIESAQKVRLVRKLKDFPLKIFGNNIWTKYISDKQEYMGAVNIKDSIDIVNRAKIVLHPHVSIYGGGLHERFLNAASSGTFVLSSENKTIMKEFGNSFGYFNFGNIEEQATYYLSNVEIRKSMQNEAKTIVHNKHCWTNRVEQILTLFK